MVKNIKITTLLPKLHTVIICVYIQFIWVTRMALFALSDVVITTTLIVNALALLASPLPVNPPVSPVSPKALAALNSESESQKIPGLIKDDGEIESLLPHGADTPSAIDGAVVVEGDELGGKVRRCLAKVRVYSGVIVLWNVVFWILMVLVFSD